MKKIICSCPPETEEKLNNPCRGFYSVFKFLLTDNAEDAEREAATIFTDKDDALLLLEINLRGYSESEISESGIKCLETLFDSLRHTGKQLIVRFLYDWEGSITTEPREITTVLRHMEQVGETVKKNSDIIYVLQGLFIGKWGEMHGTRFSQANQIKRLAVALDNAIGNKVKTSLRTPSKWRCVTGCLNSAEASPQFPLKIKMPALFNDGMMGSETDLGTYNEGERERELSFQNELCRYVPNGGEVVYDTALSDAESALAILNRTHVSYLNRDHDEVTLNKWKSIKISGANNGQSFFDYVGARLGYRYVMTGVRIKRKILKSKLKVEVDVKNTGFAPVYNVSVGELVLVNSADECDKKLKCELKGDVRTLFGGGDGNTVTLNATVSTKGLHGEYDIYFRLYCKRYDRIIYLANERVDGYGHKIGRISLK